MSYALTVKVDPSQVQQLNSQGQRLCFACGVTDSSSGTLQYNVIASVSDVSEVVTIQWTDEYSIAASKNIFQEGVQIMASTQPVRIEGGQSYSLPRDWSDGSVSSDPDRIRKGRFQFYNQTSGAAAVVYRQINGVTSPIYFSQYAPLDPGTTEYTPGNKVLVWFAPNARASTMLQVLYGEAKHIDMTRESSASANYTADGYWDRD